MLNLIAAFVFITNSLSVAQISNNLESADKVMLDSLIKNRNEKLLLINIWATWCIPCREEFPDLVKIADKFSGKMDVVAISVDFADEIESKVKPFLKTQNVNFPVLINDFKQDEDLINYFGNDWNGALPATFIYGRDGKQKRFLEGKQSLESFSSILKNIL